MLHFIVVDLPMLVSNKLKFTVPYTRYIPSESPSVFGSYTGKHWSGRTKYTPVFFSVPGIHQETPSSVFGIIPCQGITFDGLRGCLGEWWNKFSVKLITKQSDKC